MGIIIKQSIRASFFSYLGALIGCLNLLWFYPYYLEAKQVGLLGLVQSSAYLLATFGQVGMGSTLVKFFPEFKKEKGFTSLILVISHLGFLVLVGVCLFFQEQIIGYFSQESELFIGYFQLTLIVTYLLMLFQILESYCRSILDIAMPTFLRDIGLRLLTTLSILCYGLQYISFKQLVWSLTGIYGLISLVLLAYLIIWKKMSINFKLQFLSQKKLRSLINFGAFSLLGAGGTQIILQIDRIMVSGIKGLEDTGIYTIAFFIGTVIELPKRAITQLSMSLLAQKFKNGDMMAVKKLYRQTSINLFVIGSFLLVGIWCNLENIYYFVPNGTLYEKGFYVVLFIGLGKLSDMLFGANGEIIVMSKYYRFNVIAVITLAILTIIFNQWLIPMLGIRGAALASLLAMLIFNIIKYLFVWTKLHMQPFTFKTLVLLGIIVWTYLGQSLLPSLDKEWLDLLMRSSLITALFVTPLYLLKISEEVNSLLDPYLNYLKRRQ